MTRRPMPELDIEGTVRRLLEGGFEPYRLKKTLLRSREDQVRLLLAFCISNKIRAVYVEDQGSNNGA